MSAPSEGLMKLVALTKQQRDLGPLLQDYVQRRYGVESMAAFTKAEIDGVDDKDALYLQWVKQIEAGDLSLFRADGAAPEPADAAVEPADAARPDGGETGEPTSESSDTSGDAETSGEGPTDPEAQGDQAHSGAEPPVAAPPAAATVPPKGQTLGGVATEGSVDALILSMIQRAIDGQPKPEQSMTEDRIREIVRDELRTMMKSLLA